MATFDFLFSFFGFQNMSIFHFKKSFTRAFFFGAKFCQKEKLYYEL